MAVAGNRGRVRVELVDDGGDGPAVVYLPGIGGTGVLFGPCALRLRGRFRVLRLRYVDGGADSYAGLADSTLAVLDACGLDRAVFLAESFAQRAAPT